MTTQWKQITRLGLAVVGVVALVAVVAKIVSPQPWWPGWNAIIAWASNWWSVIALAAAVIGLLVLRRRLPQPSTMSTDARSPKWVHQPGGGWLRVATGEAAADSSTELRRPDWPKVASMVTAFTALAALVFTALSLAATRDQIDVSEQGQITDRLTTAVSQIGTLGADHLETRLGGIYALERVAIDSPRDQPTIVEVLSAFVRSNTLAAIVGTTYKPNSACEVPRLLPMDVQAALTVLGRRNPAHDANAVVDFTGACLVGADLTGANLKHANLTDANLAGDNLTGANLAGDDLNDANLTGADLKDAALTDVYPR